MSSGEIYSRDLDDVVRNAAHTGWQVASIAVPPFYVALTLARRGRSALTLNSVLRAQWIGGIAGTGVGAGTGYTWLSRRDRSAIHDLASRQRYDAARVRRNDYSIAGAVLGAALSPALFWNYGRAFDLILGGASFGCAAGVLTHVGKAMSPRIPAPAPPVPTPSPTQPPPAAA